MSVHVAPASSERNSPPFSCSTSATTRFASTDETEMPILPSIPAGSPCACVISVHVSPPSVDLYIPLPGPPLDICHSLRYASQSAAYMTFGFFWSISTSMPPDAGPLYRTLRQLFPPSVDLKMPRSSLLTPYFPKSATNTMFGFVGWMRMREIASEFPKPTFVQVFPASVDLYTPSPGWMSPRMHDSPMPMKTTFGSVALTATAPTDELWICPSVTGAQCSPPSVVFQSPPPVAPK